jgi:predicted ArsR family transcriptional regulator
MRELVAATGLHENAVRRALARRTARGDVHVEPEPRRSRGRPRLRYRLADSPDEPFSQFLRLLLELVGCSPASDEAAYSIGRARAEAVTQGSASEAVKRSLAGLGFAPRRRPATEAGVSEFALSLCPFSEAVTSSAQGGRICALHRGLVAGVAEARGGALREFVINDPRSAPCRVAVLDAGVHGPGQA